MKYSKIIIAICAICVFGAIVYFLSNDKGGSPAESPAPSASEAPAQAVEESPSLEPPKTPVVEIKDESGTLDKLHEILLAASEYHDDASKSTVVISQNGFLYNVAADIVVTPDYLVKKDYLSEDYTVPGALVLYLNPEDVAEILPFDDYSNKLRLYTAAPYEDGYAVDTRGYGAVKVSNDDFGKIINMYNIKHGEIRRITGSSKEYASINEAIKDYEGVSSDFYIRYGMADDKYAVIIVSPKDSYDVIHQYVLVFEDGKWKVRIPNLEAVEKARLVVNNVCLDMDIALMPNYDLKSFSGLMINDFTGITETLVAHGYLTEEDANLKYISAADKYMYVTYENGQKFSGLKIGDTWVLGEVFQPDDALAQFKSQDKWAPDFVIIWE